MTIPGGCLGFLPSTVCCSKWALLLLVFIEQHGDASNKKPILRQRIYLWYNDTSTICHGKWNPQQPAHKGWMRWFSFQVSSSQQGFYCIKRTIRTRKCSHLGSGFKHFLFSPRTLGKWSYLTSVFFKCGWWLNRQLVIFSKFFTAFESGFSPWLQVQ